jgi:hypothetical protein
MHGLNRGSNHGSPSMPYITLGLLVVLLSYVFVQAVHHTSPNPRPNAPLHDPR